DLQTLAREAPRKVSDTLSLLADNRFQIRVTGLEESRLMENLQKIANRITTGIITAALIVAAAMIMRIETDVRLFGYPALALVLFLFAAALGVCIVISALFGDRRARPREESGPH
ncbi:MAG TPA: AarF/ABC1/UbiB kinase family protein, partial [Lysobacter sp.]|nr:AarF/ABC1/UbiB kinase family protein [Lysobacter sp.]